MSLHWMVVCETMNPCDFSELAMSPNFTNQRKRDFCQLINHCNQQKSWIPLWKSCRITKKSHKQTKQSTSTRQMLICLVHLKVQPQKGTTCLGTACDENDKMKDVKQKKWLFFCHCSMAQKWMTLRECCSQWCHLQVCDKIELFNLRQLFWMPQLMLNKLK